MQCIESILIHWNSKHYVFSFCPWACNKKQPWFFYTFSHSCHIYRTRGLLYFKPRSYIIPGYFFSDLLQDCSTEMRNQFVVCWILHVLVQSAVSLSILVLYEPTDIKGQVQNTAYRLAEQKANTTTETTINYQPSQVRRVHHVVNKIIIKEKLL